MVYQQDQGAKAKPIDWYMMTKEPYLHIGQPLVAYNAYEYRTYYPMRHIVGEETSSLIGCFRQGRYENLIVFSDTYFEKVKDYWKTTDMNTGEPVEPDEAVLENTIHGPDGAGADKPAKIRCAGTGRAGRSDHGRISGGARL